MTLSVHMRVTLAIAKSNFCYVNHHNCPATDTAVIAAATVAAAASAIVVAADASATADDDAAASDAIVDAAAASNTTASFDKSQRGYLSISTNSNILCF